MLLSTSKSQSFTGTIKVGGLTVMVKTLDEFEVNLKLFTEIKISIVASNKIKKIENIQIILSFYFC